MSSGFNSLDPDSFDFFVTFSGKTPCCSSDINLCSCNSSLDPMPNSSPSLPWQGSSSPLPASINSPIKIPVLSEILSLDPDRQRALYLREGFTVGFRIGFVGDVVQTRPKNLRSARLCPHGVRTAIQTEIRRGHTSGPFPYPPFPVTHISPLGAVPKPDGTVCLILDLSSPRGCSINEGISKEDYSVEYIKFDDALSLVREAGRGCSMAKIDIRHAFRIMPVHPDDWHKLCFFLDGYFFVDTRLSFGSRSSPHIFNTFARFVAWFLSAIIGIALLTHYLDDYFIVAPSQAECRRDMNKMLSTCDRLGVPINFDKVFGPLSTLTFLGIEIDSNRMICRLPQDKLLDIKHLLSLWLSKKSCRKRDLLSLIGKLAFACKVVKPGRFFLRRLINLSMTVPHLDYFISISSQAREDIKWWHQFISEWNGVSFIPDSGNKVKLFTFASSIGFGGFLREHLFSLPLPISHQDLHIYIKELLAEMAAIFTWAKLLENKNVVLFSDNLDIVQIWTSGYTTNSQMMKLIRILFLFCARRNTHLSLRHIYGFKNCKADALSRLNISLFKQLHPTAEEEPSQVPTTTWEL